VNDIDEVVWQNSLFAGSHSFFQSELSVVISGLLILFAGLLIRQVNVNHSSVKTREHLLILLWIIQTGCFQMFHSVTEVHFATIFILLSYNHLFNIDVKRNDNNYSIIFFSSVYLGVAAIFYSLSTYLLIPHIIAVYRFKSVSFRDWIILITGFLIPFYFALFVSFFLNGDWFYPVQQTVNNIIPHFPLEKADLSVPQYVFCLFIVILIVIQQLYVRSMRLNQKTVSFDLSFFRLLIFSIAIFLLFSPNSQPMLQIIFIPTTVLLGRLFANIKKNMIANLLFITIILIAIACAFV
jgi:hypothetical protein